MEQSRMTDLSPKPTQRFMGLIWVLLFSGCSFGGSDEAGESAGTGGHGTGKSGEQSTGGAHAVGAGGEVTGAAGGSPGADETGGTSGTANGGAQQTGGSSGSGGTSPGLSCENSFEAAGHQGCELDLGIATKYYPLTDDVQAERLALYFHGDSADEWYENGYLITGVLDWAKERNVVVAALLSPVAYEGDDPAERAFGALSERDDVSKVQSTVEQIIAAFGVSSSELLVWSTSGGSWFLTSSFLPILGEKFQGSFALSCGASTFTFPYEWDPTANSNARARTKIWFNYGSEDFLVPGEEWSFDHFQGKGFGVSRTIHPGEGHCEHDIIPSTLAFWESTWK